MCMCVCVCAGAGERVCACVYVCLCVHVQVKEFDEVVFGVEDTGVKSLHRVYTACNSLQPRTHTGRKQPRSVPHGLHSVNTVCGDFTVTLPLHYRYITVTDAFGEHGLQ